MAQPPAAAKKPKREPRILREAREELARERAEAAAAPAGDPEPAAKPALVHANGGARPAERPGAGGAGVAAGAERQPGAGKKGKKKGPIAVGPLGAADGAGAKKKRTEVGAGALRAAGADGAAARAAAKPRGGPGTKRKKAGGAV